ncbi:hypothetical protein WMY93_005576 [Mugilogobius chulae]|uniref:Uncharacterized protein n=1 Tax=Mugilogobius chulae TaxID=88201 RepID=A0AAW0PK12_9GOBI
MAEQGTAACACLRKLKHMNKNRRHHGNQLYLQLDLRQRDLQVELRPKIHTSARELLEELRPKIHTSARELLEELRQKIHTSAGELHVEVRPKIHSFRRNHGHSFTCLQENFKWN